MHHPTRHTHNNSIVSTNTSPVHIGHYNTMLKLPVFKKARPEECACGGTKEEPDLVEVEKDHFARINMDILTS